MNGGPVYEDIVGRKRGYLGEDMEFGSWSV